jgi:hypothetical protein
MALDSVASSEFSEMKQLPVSRGAARISRDLRLKASVFESSREGIVIASGELFAVSHSATIVGTTKATLSAKVLR